MNHFESLQHAFESRINWWEITLGISNTILAIVVAISAWIISKKDRKVHIADKRMRWIEEFRQKVSLFTSVHQRTVLLLKQNDGEVAGEIGFNIMSEYLNHSFHLEMMLIDEIKNPHFEDLRKELDKIKEELLSESNNGDSEFHQNGIIQISKKVIGHEWQKIKFLKN